MVNLEFIVLTLSAFGTSVLTAVVGAGGGTALIAIMLQFMSPANAIPVHGAVQIASNSTRVWLLRKHLAWSIIFRFVVLMPFGVWLGLELLQGLSTQVIQILIGCFVLVSLLARQIGRFKEKDLPLIAFIPIGFLAGALNMVVGVVAPILGVLVIRKSLTRESIVGTLGFFGFIGHLLKIVGFTIIGFNFIEYGPEIFSMGVATVIGTRIGRSLLSKLNEKYFLLAFRLVLLSLSFKLIVIDGMGLLSR
jgi:uncharacterized membrane protein YfcA